MSRSAAAAAALLAMAALLSPPAHAKDEPAPVIAGADVKARLAAATELEQKDPLGLARALAAIGNPVKGDRTADREFLLAYALGERDRALRLVAIDAAARIDRRAAADFFRAKADAQDTLVTITAVEGLGLTGTKDDVEFLLGLVKNPSELIAVAACRALNRVATRKDADRIVEVGLDHKESHVTDHCAWIVQDVLGKSKLAAEKFQRVASKKSDPRAVRAESTVAILEDKLAQPHEWTDSLDAARKLVLAAPAEIEIKAATEEYRKNVAAGLAWLREKLPGGELLVRASARRIDVPGAQPDEAVDLKNEILQVPSSYALQPPHKMAYHLLRIGTVLFEKRIGNPYMGHRGWESPILDSYDLCVIAGLYDAGPSGLSRERFLQDQLERRPWGGN